MEILRHTIRINISLDLSTVTRGDSVITEIKDTGVITRGTSTTGMEAATSIRSVIGDMMGIGIGKTENTMVVGTRILKIMDTIHLIITTSSGRATGMATMTNGLTITQDEEEITDITRVVDQTEIRGADDINGDQTEIIGVGDININHGMTGPITGSQKTGLKRGIDTILGR